LRASHQSRAGIAARRLGSILRAHIVATARTLEQKISDAGPGNQRVDPHILTEARNDLVKSGVLTRLLSKSVPWFHLSTANPQDVGARLAEQEPIHQQLQKKDFGLRMGQSLEIAVYRSLLAHQPAQVLGAYTDLDAHADDLLYQKEEPPSSLSGKQITGKRKLDFLLIHPEAKAVGIEIKNIREWLYPDRDEIREMLLKCCQLDAVPLLIGRRIPFVTFRLLNPCGVITHQTYGQRFPDSDVGLAALARDKRLLAYHDIRLGNQPDARLDKFIGTNLPKILRKARVQFDAYSDLLQAYGAKDIGYQEFAARVRRRELGQNEDDDWESG